MTGHCAAVQHDALLAADLNAAIANAGGGGTGVTKTDRSGTIALGGQAQALMPANASRKGWSFQNRSGGSMWFDDLRDTPRPRHPTAPRICRRGPITRANCAGALGQRRYGRSTSDVTGDMPLVAAKEWGDGCRPYPPCISRPAIVQRAQ